VIYRIVPSPTILSDLDGYFTYCKFLYFQYFRKYTI